jgi:signal transduction histidine kinase
MTSVLSDQKRITIATRITPAGATEVSVGDRGPGIKPTDEKRLFEPFYTTKDKGLGLGLAICSTIMQAHGGRLTLANRDGGGAVATFSLPAQELMVAAK